MNDDGGGDDGVSDDGGGDVGSDDGVEEKDEDCDDRDAAASYLGAIALQLLQLICNSAKAAANNILTTAAIAYSSESDASPSPSPPTKQSRKM